MARANAFSMRRDFTEELLVLIGLDGVFGMVFSNTCSTQFRVSNSARRRQKVRSPQIDGSRAFLLRRFYLRNLRSFLFLQGSMFGVRT